MFETCETHQGTNVEQYSSTYAQSGYHPGIGGYSIPGALFSSFFGQAKKDKAFRNYINQTFRCKKFEGSL